MGTVGRKVGIFRDQICLSQKGNGIARKTNLENLEKRHFPAYCSH
jgi:hypothetical protein